MAGKLGLYPWRLWLAGVIDTEGYITVGRRLWPANGQAYYTLTVAVGNTNLDLLDRVQAVAGCGTIRPISRRRQGTKPAWVWRAYGQDAVTIIRAVKGSLVVKGAQARLALDLQATKLSNGYHRSPAVAEQQATIYEAMRQLNKRGLTDDSQAQNVKRPAKS